jgi:serine/threonine protein kinase
LRWPVDPDAPRLPLSPSPPLPSGGRERLGRYELCAKLADGGMATVNVAITREGADAGRVVAVKMIREEFARSAEFAAMFLDEARIVGGLRHPNVLRYDELGREGGRAFIAMELLYGQSLWSVWEACRARRVRLRYPMIAWIGARVASGLHYAHEATDPASRPLDVVHRDVNPTNVFVTYEGEVKVIDFGLAKAKNRASRTAAGVIKGKVAYMSPEQAVGGVLDRRSDLFALGTMLWELASDRRLFKHADEVETLRRVNAAAVPDPTALIDGFPPALCGQSISNRRRDGRRPRRLRPRRDRPPRRARVVGSDVVPLPGRRRQATRLGLRRHRSRQPGSCPPQAPLDLLRRRRRGPAGLEHRIPSPTPAVATRGRRRRRNHHRRPDRPGPPVTISLLPP